MVDLLDIFERDNNSNRRDGAPSRRGLRGLLDRVTGALDLEGDDDDRRRRDAATTTTQQGTNQENRRRERESFFDDD